MTIGSKEAAESSEEFQDELSAKIEGPLKGFALEIEGKASRTLRSSLTRNQYKEVVTTTTVHLDKPCYVYQITAKVPTRHGLITIPLHKHISPTPLTMKSSNCY